MAVRRVVAISKALKTFGEDVGRRVAEEMGYRYVDEEVIAEAARAAAVPLEVLEDVEKRRSAVRRLVGKTGLAPDKSIWQKPGHDGAAAPPQSPPAYRALIRDVIAATAAQGRVVIVAHAASIPLAGKPSVLRVSVVASHETRVRRLVEDGLSEDAAKKALARDERGRREYFRTFYGIPRELPTHYDLVVNTDGLSASDAAKAIAAFARI